MKVIVIKYKDRYEDFDEIVGITSNKEIAKLHIERLKEKYPHMYEYDDERFSFEEYEFIEV